MANVQKRVDKKTVKRASWIMLIFAFFSIVLILVVGKMQTIDYEAYRTKVIDQMTVSTVINPLRGQITDRNGNILAANATNYLVFISPQDIIDQVKADAEADEKPVYKWTAADGTEHEDTYADRIISKALSEILDVDYDMVLEKSALAGRRYEVIKKEVSEADAELVRQFIADNDFSMQIYLRASNYRMYPYGNLASQVIGFTNKDGVGIYGIESYYNNLLEGTSGKYITAQDARSNDMPFEYESQIDPENGYTIETTIDTYIQYELENQLKATYEENGAAERACGIVMNVNNGEIYAMATYPQFDLNSPYTLDEDSMKQLEGLDPNSEEYSEKRFELLYRMWSNKAVTGLYEPGSTFKPITSAMGFDEGVVTVNDTFYCPGHHLVKGYGNVSCHEHAGHGLVTFTQGLQQSCNPTMMILGERLGTELFYKYFLAFGYGDKTGIDLPAEAKGIITPQSGFGNVELAVYTFGQTFKTTPLQQIRALACVANGGYLVTPHVLKSVKDRDGNTVAQYNSEPLRQVVSTETTDTITKILEEGVSGDGGAKNAYVKGYKVAAKTGTSEKQDKYDENGNRPYRVSSCMGFAPADNPEIITIIVVDEPTNGVVYGSRVAAPYISNLLSYVLPYLGYEAEYTEEDLANEEVTVPSLVGCEIEVAKNDLAWREINYEVVGNGNTVKSQLPAGSETMSKSGGKVILYTGDELPRADVVVPDVTGKTAEAVNRILINAGLNVSYTGAAGSVGGAVVVNQSIQPNTSVPAGTVITVTLQYTDSHD